MKDYGKPATVKGGGNVPSFPITHQFLSLLSKSLT